MQIRRLGEGDGPLLEAVARRLLAPPGAAASPSRRLVDEALADPRCYFLVCLHDDAPVGYLGAYRFPAVEHDGYIVYLYDLVVHPERRRQGIGTRLVAALLERCRGDRVTRVWVGTALDNRAARRTFEATGARRVSETYVEYVYDLTPTLR